MLQIRSEAFIGLGRVAGFLRNHSQLMNALAVLLEEEERTTFIDQIERLASACKDLELTTAATVVAKTLARLKAAETLSWLTVKSDYDHVMEIIEIELAQHVFLWVQPTRVKYWRPEIPDVVQTRFGSAADDIRHASVCIALEADTASVYHSMRALEKGLISLAREVSVPYETAQWHNIIESIASKVEAMKTLPHGTHKIEEQQFYSEAAKEFMYFKDAWRNHVMHSRRTYDFGQAVKVLAHVADFMAHIAQRLHE